MKPARVVLAICTLNASLVVVAALLLAGAKSQADQDFAASHRAPAKAARVTWHATPADSQGLLPEATLSMRARPAPPVEEVSVVVAKADEPTDDELRTELQLALNRRYALQRTVTWVEGNDSPGAFLLCGRTRLFVFEGMNLNDLTGRDAAARADVEVKAIATDHVLVNAPSIRRPDRRFDVRLELSQPPTSTYQWR